MPLELEIDGLINDEMAETVTYTPVATGTGLPVSAIIDRQGGDEERTEKGWFNVRRASLLIDGQTIQLPDVSDRVTFDGVEWNVERYKPAGANAAYLVEVVRRERFNKMVK